MRMCRLCLFDRNDDTATRCRQCGGDMAPDDEDDDDDADSAFFHYLRVPNLGTIELVPGRAFRVGKDARNELVLPRASQGLVATLFWTDDYDEVTVKEEGAQEPIKVDGVRLKGVRTLKGGEEVEVGALRLGYLRRATPVEGAIDARKTGQRDRPDPTRPVAATGQVSGRAASFYGEGGLAARRSAPARAGERRSVGAAPADVALALEKIKASGTLRVKSDAGRGWVVVVAGAPRHAAFGGLTGRRALDAILRLTRGSCQVVRGGPPPRGQGERLQVSFSQALAAVRGPVRPTPPGPRPVARPGPPTGPRKGPPPPGWGGAARRS
ncbi:MAG: DUF4388 domain-containing protein [Planctomycetes bacterium]|nr:DUF4388 domain-containing protein [Planctomycetota bacterium]